MVRAFVAFVFLSLSVLADTSRAGNKTALVLIDMQEYFMNRTGTRNEPANAKKLEALRAEQIKLITHAREQNIPVVLIEYENFGSTTSSLRDALAGYDNTKTIKKSADGMFDERNTHVNELSDYLHEKEVGNLIIAGANGGGCVQDSILGSLRHNYNVIAYAQAIADFNFQDFIYPYRGRFTGVANPGCDNCTFREVSSLEGLTLMLNQFQRDNTSGAVNDSDRSVPRRDIPVYRQGRPARIIPSATTRQ